MCVNIIMAKEKIYFVVKISSNLTDDLPTKARTFLCTETLNYTSDSMVTSMAEYFSHSLKQLYAIVYVLSQVNSLATRLRCGRRICNKGNIL